jgi:hypothetical protein
MQYIHIIGRNVERKKRQKQTKEGKKKIISHIYISYTLSYTHNSKSFFNTPMHPLKLLNSLVNISFQKRNEVKPQHHM